MGKNIWIINEYAGSPYHGMEFRHYYLGKELVKLGHSVNVVSSSYSHLFKKLPEKSQENIDGINYVWLKTLNYGDSHNKKRVLKWFIFSYKIFFLPFKLKNPDVIIVSPMAPFPIFPAWFLAKIYHCKLIYEVKDIWPLSLVELGGFSSKHPFIRVMSWFEKFALNNSKTIVSNLQNYGLYIKDYLKIDKKFEWISNGVDLEELCHGESLSQKVIDQIPRDAFVVGYTGTIGVANALEYFCESMKYVKIDNIIFVIVGNGQEKGYLVKKYGYLDNMLFIDFLDKKQVQSMLDLFDVCYIGWRNKSIYKYGIAANKIFDYMYSGKPILHSYSGGGDLVVSANCGVSVKAGRPQSIANKVLELYNMSKEKRENLGENGKKYVLENFTYEKLAQKYEALF